MKNESFLFKVFFWGWFFSIPFGCVWWADLVTSNWGDSPNPLVALMGLAIVFGGWLAYIRGSFWVLFEVILPLVDPKKKP